MRAIWKNEIIAESDQTVVVEGNHYFPPESVKKEYLKKSGDTYTCPWKGHADYYDVIVEGDTIKNGAFMYPDPSSAAARIKGYFAFWQGIEVIN